MQVGGTHLHARQVRGPGLSAAVLKAAARVMGRAAALAGGLAAVSAVALLLDRTLLELAPATAGWVYLLVVLVATIHWGRAYGLAAALAGGVLDYALFVQYRPVPVGEHHTALVRLVLAVVCMAITAEIVDRVSRVRLAAVQRSTEQAEWERVQRQRQADLAGIAHDLRTPVTVIHAQAQFLVRRVLKGTGPDSEVLRAGLVAIDEAAVRMTAAIDEVLDVSRLQAGQQLELRCTPVDLVSLVREEAELVGRDETDHPISVLAERTEIVGTWDRRRLARVLDNLLANAIKYSPEGGAIEVRLSADAGAGAMLSVRDQGIGIPARDLPEVFNWYRRGSNVAGHIPGSGVGLAAAKQIVELHGGTIAVESEEQHGTTVTVRLPVNGAA